MWTCLTLNESCVLQLQQESLIKTFATIAFTTRQRATEALSESPPQFSLRGIHHMSRTATSGGTSNVRVGAATQITCICASQEERVDLRVSPTGWVDCRG